LLSAGMHKGGFLVSRGSGHWVFPFTVLCCLLLAATGSPALAVGAGTLEDPVVDSAMTWVEAVVRRTGPPVPEKIQKRQFVLKVCYRSFDGLIHQGQIVVDRRLVPDLQEVFRVALQAHFPIDSVIPISHARFQWDDQKSMAANNTSGFNYRTVTGATRLSKHALGFAVDINPVQNPYVRGDQVLPRGATYDPKVAGTLHPECPVVRAFLRLGWTWGGRWSTLKDYQHFQKVP
jgi:peptidoglycan LD-endopeptidase CwlK